MIYDLSDDFELKKAEAYFKASCEAKGKIKMSNIKNKRSVTQNAYLHVCISLYAINFGLNIEEAKTDLKRCCHFMVYEKKNNKYLKRTRDMDSKELTDFIEWIRTYASKHGCYIPSSEEYLQNQFSINKEIERNKEFL